MQQLLLLLQLLLLRLLTPRPRLHLRWRQRGVLLWCKRQCSHMCRLVIGVHRCAWHQTRRQGVNWCKKLTVREHGWLGHAGTWLAVARAERRAILKIETDCEFRS
jgi:hypothetical protein